MLYTSFDRALNIISESIIGDVENYLKSLDKGAVAKYREKLVKGYRVGIKFTPNDSLSDIEATLTLFDPENPEEGPPRFWFAPTAHCR
jgi:hypothetical protein